MDSTDFIRVFLPSFVLVHFDVTKLVDNTSRIDIYLDENRLLPAYLECRPVISYGFTAETVVQDFPIRGKAVYLHIRRRKWYCKDDNSIHTHSYDLTHVGTELTAEFVAFLKATN